MLNPMHVNLPVHTRLPTYFAARLPTLMLSNAHPRACPPARLPTRRSWLLRLAIGRDCTALFESYHMRPEVG